MYEPFVLLFNIPGVCQDDRSFFVFSAHVPYLDTARFIFFYLK